MEQLALFLRALGTGMRKEFLEELPADDSKVSVVSSADEQYGQAVQQARPGRRFGLPQRSATRRRDGDGRRRTPAPSSSATRT